MSSPRLTKAQSIDAMATLIAAPLQPKEQIIISKEGKLYRVQSGQETAVDLIEGKPKKIASELLTAADDLNGLVENDKEVISLLEKVIHLLRIPDLALDKKKDALWAGALKIAALFQKNLKNASVEQVKVTDALDSLIKDLRKRRQTLVENDEVRSWIPSKSTTNDRKNLQPHEIAIMDAVEIKDEFAEALKIVVQHLNHLPDTIMLNANIGPDTVRYLAANVVTVKDEETENILLEKPLNLLSEESIVSQVRDRYGKILEFFLKKINASDDFGSWVLLKWTAYSENVGENMIELENVIQKIFNQCQSPLPWNDEGIKLAKLLVLFSQGNIIYPSISILVYMKYYPGGDLKLKQRENGKKILIDFSQKDQVKATYSQSLVKKEAFDQPTETMSIDFEITPVTVVSASLLNLEDWKASTTVRIGVPNEGPDFTTAKNVATILQIAGYTLKPYTPEKIVEK